MRMAWQDQRSIPLLAVARDATTTLNPALKTHECPGNPSLLTVSSGSNRVSSTKGMFCRRKRSEPSSTTLELAKRLAAPSKATWLVDGRLSVGRESRSRAVAVAVAVTVGCNRKCGTRGTRKTTPRLTSLPAPRCRRPRRERGSCRAWTFQTRSRRRESS